VAVLILAMLAIERDWWFAVIVIFLVGMFIKETTILAAFYPLLTSRPLRDRLRLCACAVPGIVAYGAIRLVIDPVDYRFSYGATDWLHNLAHLASPSGVGDWRSIVLSLGPLWVLLPFALRRDWGGLPRRYIWFVLLCVAFAVALSAGYERMLFLSFPVAAGLTLPLVDWLLAEREETVPAAR
jgi:hypothetical protein